jgi:hypothetical protein
VKKQRSTGENWKDTRTLQGRPVSTKT